MRGRFHASLGSAVVLLIAFLPLPAAAKGSFESILVYGEGEVLRVTDPSLLSFDAFTDFSIPYPGTPSVTTAGFFIVRGGIDTQTGEFAAIDTLRLFPTSLSTGSKPFVFYEGLVNGWSEYDKKWYFASPEATAALLEHIESDGRSPFLPRYLRLLPLTLSAIAGAAAGMAATRLLRRPRS